MIVSSNVQASFHIDIVTPSAVLSGRTRGQLRLDVLPVDPALQMAAVLDGRIPVISNSKARCVVRARRESTCWFDLRGVAVGEERGDVSKCPESGCRGWDGAAVLGQEGLDLVNGPTEFFVSSVVVGASAV